MNSILTSIKKLLGIAETDTSFDNDLIMHINSVFMILQQLGVGPSTGYAITSASNVWSEFMSGSAVIHAVKSYMGLKVRLLFDPPLSAGVKDAIDKNIAELEWRINVMVETGAATSQDVEQLKTRVTALETKTTEHDDLFKTLVGDEDE